MAKHDTVERVKEHYGTLAHADFIKLLEEELEELKIRLIDSTSESFQLDQGAARKVRDILKKVSK